MLQIPASCWGSVGVWGRSLSLHSDVTDVRCCSGRWRQRGIVSCFMTRCTVSRQAAQTLTVCAPFSIIVLWVFPYPDIGAKIWYPDFWISINNPTPELKLHGFSLTRKYLSQCMSLTVAAVAATMFTDSPLLHWCQQTTFNQWTSYCGICRIAMFSSMLWNCVMWCWHDYLSAVRCRWFAHGPADTTATPSFLASLKCRLA